MSFLKINTNVASMNALTNSQINDREIDKSVARLSSGLRINKAADDSSGMAIADSLRSQANALGQAIRNANDAIGIIQIADKAMDEQIKICDTIKTKAIQAAQDGQNQESRTAIQRDINRLVEQLNNIAVQTSFNGMKLLAGSFVNKEFQVGAYSNETVKASIGSTLASKIGGVRLETTATITAASETTLVFQSPTGAAPIQLESVVISYSAGTGLGALAEAINTYSDIIGTRATYNVQSTGETAVEGGGTIRALTINGISIGDIDNTEDNDRNGNLVNAINSFSMLTGVYASIDEQGRLNLTARDGRGIHVTTSAGGTSLGLGGGTSAGAHENYGRLTLVHSNARDINYTATGSLSNKINSAGYQAFVNMEDVIGNFTALQGAAGGAYANAVQSAASGQYLGVGVTTRQGAMITMDVADAALKLLDEIRADLGAVQNQIQVTVDNVSNAQVNVQNSESTIRDLDFGAESANFSKQSILAQSGSFALSQANQIQQNVLRLLQ
ncbi:MAG: flagellin B [Helicobacteraceae bacterium]|jgi:flagellin|nr:flagellin B [Helicobacteraceae bacterium]